MTHVLLKILRPVRIAIFIWVVSLGASEIPGKPFKVNDSTVILWHLNRGPWARNAVANGPKGKIEKASWSTSGKFAAGLNFSGKAGGVSTKLSDIQLPRRQIDVWLKPEIPKDGKARIVWHEVESPGVNRVLLLQANGKLCYQRIYCGRVKDSVMSGSAIDFSKWNFVSLYVDSIKDKVWFLVNGIADREQKIVIGGIGCLCLGGAANNEVIPYASFLGAVDEFRIQKCDVLPKAEEECQVKPYISDAAALVLYHCERIRARGKIPDSSSLARHGTATKTVRLAPGKFGRALSFNGVDSFVFTGKPPLSALVGTSLEFWFCPAISPTDTVAGVFLNVFPEEERKFSLSWDESTSRRGPTFFARRGPNAESGADWGVHKYGRKADVCVLGKEGADMHLLAAAAPFSGSRQRLFLRRKNGHLRWETECPWAAMESKSVVWKAGLWTHVRIVLDVNAGIFSMYVNGNKEAETKAVAILPTHTFSLGGSLFHGVPFAGLIDEFRVQRLVAEKYLSFPVGAMECPFEKRSNGVELPLGISSVGFTPEDRASRETENVFCGKSALRLVLNGKDRGIVGRIIGKSKSGGRVSVYVKGAKGSVRMMFGKSNNLNFARTGGTIALDGTWKKLEAQKADDQVFIIFSEPGEYVVDDLQSRSPI